MWTGNEFRQLLCHVSRPPADGRAEIEAEHRRWFEDGETNKTMAVTRAGIDGDLGYCLVHFEADVPGEGGGNERFRGTSLNVMQRGAAWSLDNQAHKPE